MDRIGESLARTALWGALAEAFRRPGDGPFEALGELPGAAEALGLDARDLLAAPRDGLAGAYDALFGHVVRGPCPAHEGEYGEPKGHRFAHEIGDVTGFYAAFGLGPSRSHPERPDHIAVECEFLALLALKEACAADQHGAEKADLCRAASRRFLDEHLGRFGRALAARVRRRASVPFYVEAARLLDAAIVSDAARLGAAAGPEDLPLREDAGPTDDACMRCSAVPETPR
jgi:TorA maturation chaperone TorD